MIERTGNKRGRKGRAESATTGAAATGGAPVKAASGGAQPDVEGSIPDAARPERFVGFLRLPSVLRLYPVGRSTWYRMVAAGEAPQPVTLSTGISAWRTADIVAFCDERARRRDDKAA
jgi:prophage regulatory protein